MNFYTINENGDGSYTCSHVNKCEKQENAYSVNMNNDLFEVERCFIFEFLPEDIRGYLTHLNNYIMNNEAKGKAIDDLREKHRIRNFFETQLGIQKITPQDDRASSKDRELKQTILRNIGVNDIDKNATKLKEKIESINKELQKRQGSNTEIDKEIINIKNTEINNKIINIKQEIINDYNKFIESIDSLYKKIETEKLARRTNEKMEDLLNRIPEQNPNKKNKTRKNNTKKIPSSASPLPRPASTSMANNKPLASPPLASPRHVSTSMANNNPLASPRPKQIKVTEQTEQNGRTVDKQSASSDTSVLPRYNYGLTQNGRTVDEQPDLYNRPDLITSRIPPQTKIMQKL
jgi:hypothetical protein